MVRPRDAVHSRATGHVPADAEAAALAVDLVVLTIRAGELVVVLVRRGIAPQHGRWALPGGFVHAGEALEVAARRELEEETGITHLDAHLEQLATYGEPGRDPRGRVVSVAYLALVADPGDPVAGSDAAASAWLPVTGACRGELGGLAFDHGRILADGVERARAKLEYTSLAAALCPTEFTVAELRRVYEAVWGVELDPRNFHRKVTGTDGFLQPVEGTTTRDGGRPAQLFRVGPTGLLHPPLLRPAAGA